MKTPILNKCDECGKCKMEKCITIREIIDLDRLTKRNKIFISEYCPNCKSIWEHREPKNSKYKDKDIVELLDKASDTLEKGWIDDL